jgi:hypothetical protein
VIDLNHEFWVSSVNYQFALRAPLTTQRITFEIKDYERVGGNKLLATIVFELSDFLLDKDRVYDSGLYW